MSVPRALSSVVLGASLVGAVPAAIVERSSGTSFPEQVSVGGESFACVGAGVRKVFVVRAYAMTFCVPPDEVPAISGFVAHEHAGLSGDRLSSVLREDGAFFRRLATSESDKLVVMKALRDIPAEKLREAFRESLSDVLPPASIERLLAVLTTDVKSGESVRIRSDGAQVRIDLGGTSSVVDDAEVARKLWLVWLGPDSVTPSLKDDIAQRLGHAAAPGAEGR